MDENCHSVERHARFDGGSESLLSSKLELWDDARPLSKDELISSEFILSSASPLTQPFGRLLERRSGKPTPLHMALLILSDIQTSELCFTGLKNVLTTTSEPIFSFIRGFTSDLFVFVGLEVELTPFAVDSSDLTQSSDL